jgi:hypothetical protein
MINEQLHCECGRMYSRQHKSKHLKTKLHHTLMHELSLSSSGTVSEVFD